MELLIITGMSGAGKSRAVEILEDAGFYCIDNMPPALIPKFAEVCFQAYGKIEKAVLVADIRGASVDKDFAKELKTLKNSGYNYKMLFLNASDETLLKRYQETRRKHPLAANHEGLLESIKTERKMMEPLREISDYTIDTSSLSLPQLKANLLSNFVKGDKKMFVNIVSFGFKYGIPLEADYVFDVRCLPNPFYIPELKDKTGRDDAVFDYVFSFPAASIYFEKIKDMLEFALPQFIEEGKPQAVIAFGCTGGKHRSVSFARRMAQALENDKIDTVVTHNDITK